MKIKFLSAIVLVSLLLTACALTPLETPHESPPNRFDEFTTANLGDDIGKINVFTLDSWSSLDNRHLILWKTAHQPYLLTLDRHCWDLRHSEAIQLTNRTNTIHSRLDAVVVSDRNFTSLPCYISQIHALTKSQAKSMRQLRRSTKVAGEKAVI